MGETTSWFADVLEIGLPSARQPANQVICKFSATKAGASMRSIRCSCKHRTRKTSDLPAALITSLDRYGPALERSPDSTRREQLEDHLEEVLGVTLNLRPSPVPYGAGRLRPNRAARRGSLNMWGIGADDEVRTRDLQGGNLLLYQLSYVRMMQGQCKVIDHPRGSDTARPAPEQGATGWT